MMEQELLRVIKANLPESTAGALRDYIQRAELNEKLLVTTQESLNLKTAELKRMEEEVKVLRSREKKLEELEEKERHLLKRESSLELEKEKEKVNHLKGSLQELYRLTEIVFRNPKLTYTDSGSTAGQGGVWTSLTRTISAEEVK